MTAARRLRVGVILNPVAGSGGPLAQKGSDDLDTAAREAAVAEGRAAARLTRMLDALAAAATQLQFYCFGAAMGGDVLRAAGCQCEVVGTPAAPIPGAADTLAAVEQLQLCDIDLLLFVGGDGTARDICSAIQNANLPVLGVPAGVKMHSGVFAVSPEAAAEIVSALITGKLVDVAAAEVRDIDEAAFRRGRVISKPFGTLQVPRIGGFLQHTKQGGREVEALAVADIAAEVVAGMDAETLYVIGPGSTTAAIMEELGLPNTLLGVDLVRDGELLASDVAAETLLQQFQQHAGAVRLLVTIIGGQGFILGRGNQQLSPAVLKHIGHAGITVLASKTKLSELEGRPLLVDSNDPEFDAGFSGLIEVITGYRDRVLYPIAAAGAVP